MFKQLYNSLVEKKISKKRDICHRRLCGKKIDLKSYIFQKNMVRIKLIYHGLVCRNKFETKKNIDLTYFFHVIHQNTTRCFF